MNEITVTIKLTPEALEEAAEKFFKMAYGLSVCKNDAPLNVNKQIVSGEPVESGPPIHIVDPDLDKARQVFGASVAKVPPVPPPGKIVTESGKIVTDISEPKKNLEGVELDDTGLPWDVRINSKNSKNEKVKVKNGTWRLKRNVDKNLVPIVLAELRAAMSAPIPRVIPTAPVAPAPVVQEVPEVPEVPAVPEPPADTPQAVTFPQFLQKVTDRSTTQWGPQYTEAVKKILAAKGIAGLPLLMARPDLIPEIDCEAEKTWVQLSVPEIQG